jgi:hypothetical protein
MPSSPISPHSTSNLPAVPSRSAVNMHSAAASLSNASIAS